jgi:hypothetical protein
MRSPSVGVASLLAFFLGSVALAQGPLPAGSAAGEDEVRSTTRAILQEIDQHSRLMADLEYLCDMIGPRLTGSPKMEQASRWTRDKFQEYGLRNAHLEGFPVARAWTRGEASGRIVAPTEQHLILESAGWSPSTRGLMRGPVVYPRGKTMAELDAYRGKLKGAWIITEPVSIHLPPHRMAHAPAGAESEDEIDTPEEHAFQEAFEDLMAAEGAAGFLRDSDKEHGLIRMASSSDDFTPARFPEALLTTESYGLIWRLLKRGPVEVEIDLSNRFSDAEVEVHNTVAELVGSEKPEETVILGAHLDSWDLGTGATDNATGAMAVLEASRALQAAGVRPRRTIRFVLFAGEEEGRHGSLAYARAHARELDRVSAVLIQDMGTGRARTIAIQERYDLREVMDRVIAPFQEELGLEEITMRKTGGTDHLSFHPYGVPAFALRQELADYFKTHHTESDTFDKVYADEINQTAKVLAAWAYNVAMLPDCLPRAPGYSKGNLVVAPSAAKPVATPTPAPTAPKRPSGMPGT